MPTAEEIFAFWFSEEIRRCWFTPTPSVDQEIRERFADLVARAAAGALTAWERSPEGCVALCILLDQMPRNMFRGTPRAFATDAQALDVAERAVSDSTDRDLAPEQKTFLYLPFVHSERLSDQLRGLALFESARLEDALSYVRDHAAIIRRFGRFPHRNAILGRSSTPEELEFLAHRTNDYGQSLERGPGAGTSFGRNAADREVGTPTLRGSRAG